MKTEKMARNENSIIQTNKVSNYKKKGKVILVAPSYIVVEQNGNTICKYGKFNVKVGDNIEI